MTAWQYVFGIAGAGLVDRTFPPPDLRDAHGVQRDVLARRAAMPEVQGQLRCALRAASARKETPTTGMQQVFIV